MLRLAPLFRDSRIRVIAGSSSIFFCFFVALSFYHFSAEAKSENDTTVSSEETTTDVHVMILIGSFAVLAFEILDFFTKHLGIWLGAKRIPVRGKHLDDLRTVDHLCIAFSKANTAPFAYLFCRYCWLNANVLWDWRGVSVLNFWMATPLLFLSFDFTYYILHWVLHWQLFYKWIHKHHHIQKAPSRGTVDAANVHPMEMFLGEYNHMVSLWFVSTWIAPVHVAAALLFLLAGGILAGINHTRDDLTITLPGGLLLFDTKAHDVHHRIPQSNYGQYTMFWDHLFGTYRPYNPNDRVNPNMQFDVPPGKTNQKSKAA